MRTAYIVVCLSTKERFKYIFTCTTDLTDLDRFPTFSAAKLVQNIQYRHKNCAIEFPDKIPSEKLRKRFRPLTIYEQQIINLMLEFK